MYLQTESSRAAIIATLPQPPFWRSSCGPPEIVFEPERQHQRDRFWYDQIFLAFLEFRPWLSWPRQSRCRSDRLDAFGLADQLALFGPSHVSSAGKPKKEASESACTSTL
jgi:hypothetical protein